jgi:molybdenum cofactor guanylyltransferase
MIHKIAGIVLAGGRSSRFGSDKGLYPYQGRPLVEHAIDILRPNFPTLIISTNNPDAYAYLNLPMVADTYPGCGPIGGIFSALCHVGAKNFSPLHGTTKHGVPQHPPPHQRNMSIAIISCDTPHVPPKLFAFLRENLAGYDAVVPVHEGFKEATCAIYTSACLPYLEQAINHKRYKILDALKQANILFLDVTSADFYREGMFYNINYLADVGERRR